MQSTMIYRNMLWDGPPVDWSTSLHLSTLDEWIPCPPLRASAGAETQ